jgi:hypothetical protein
MRWTSCAGTGFRILCLPLVLALLTSCERRSQHVKAGDKEVQELHADIDAVKNSPSLQPGSNQAGPPIHVDPYPHSAGRSHHPGASHSQAHH